MKWLLVLVVLSACSASVDSKPSIGALPPAPQKPDEHKWASLRGKDGKTIADLDLTAREVRLIPPAKYEDVVWAVIDAHQALIDQIEKARQKPDEKKK